MRNLFIGIKLIGLYFIVLGIKSIIQYCVYYVRMRWSVPDLEWENIYPYFTDFGFSIAIGWVFIFKTELVAGIISKGLDFVDSESNDQSSETE